MSFQDVGAVPKSYRIDGFREARAGVNYGRRAGGIVTGQPSLKGWVNATRVCRIGSITDASHLKLGLTSTLTTSSRDAGLTASLKLRRYALTDKFQPSAEASSWLSHYPR